MPRPFLVQDWTTVRGAAGETIVQSFERYLKLGGYVDVIFYVECSYESNSPTLSYQTSPIADDQFFYTMDFHPLTAGSLVQTKVLFATAMFGPLANFVRWSMTDASTFAATFRIWAVARPG